MPKKKQTKKKVGRPSKKDNETSDIVRKLLAAFWRGANVTEACIYAGISRETFYHWSREIREFSDTMAAARIKVNEHAKAVVVDAIYNGDIGAAKWWLERRNKKEFGPDAKDDINEPSELDKIDMDIQSSLNENIATHYRLYLIRKREILLNDYSKKNEYLVSRLDKLMKLSDKELADYAGLEIWATGNDYAGVRRKLIIRQGGDNYKDLIALADETKVKYDAFMEAEKTKQQPTNPKTLL